MVHSVPLADALADVGFLRSLLNRLPSINTPQKHDKAHMRARGRFAIEEGFGRKDADARN